MRFSTFIRGIPVLKNLYDFGSMIFQRVKYKNTVLKNQKYKDMFKGDRCFIVGNGPSLSKHDLKPLRKEHVFTVNSMSSTKEFDILQPEFHIMVDPLRFDEKQEIFLQSMKELSERKNPPICVFPVKFKNYFEKFGFDKKLEIIYAPLVKKVRRIKNIDLTKCVPPYQNVINIALYTAIYLGFEEIYLIGCDMTSFITIYGENDEVNYGGHFYERDNIKEIKYMEAIHRERANEFMLKAYGLVFELFRLTQDYALAHGIKIFNATKGGALDVFPKIKYEELFNEKDN